MKKYTKIISMLIALLMLVSLCSCSMINEPQDADGSSNSDNHVVQGTNLDGLSIYSSFRSIKYGQNEDMQDLNEDEVLLFVNGSVAQNGNAYFINNEVYIDADITAEMLDVKINKDISGAEMTIESNETKVSCKYEQIGDKFLIPMEDLLETFNCSGYYCDAETQNDEYMIESYPHVMLYNYGNGLNIRTAENALTDLKSKLITAFEKKFGEFKELAEKPEQYDEQDTLRYLISNLEVEAENNRFYIVNFVHDFYIDKYTDEIFTHYNGLDESFSLFDPLSDNALSFPG